MKPRMFLSAMLLLCMLALCACGDTESAASSISSAAPESDSEESVVEDSASDVEDSVVEDSTEEESEPTTDELFQDFLDENEDICLKARVCDYQGFPVKNGTMTLQGGEIDTTLESDSDGYTFIGNLELDTEYTLSVWDADGNKTGVVTFTLTEGEDYGGTLEDAALAISIESAETPAELALIATDSDGSASTFELYRIDTWRAES